MPPKEKTNSTLLNCGFMSGLLQAVVFNPWDRALYLSVKHHKPFIHKSNFLRPFEGVTQTIVQRAITAGLYFPLEEIFFRHFDRTLKPSAENRPWVVLLSGILAGATNGMFMNPLSAIKYHTWGLEHQAPHANTPITATVNFYTVAKEMWRKGGTTPFLTGSAATIMRDVKFGGVFALLRYQWNSSYFTKDAGKGKVDIVTETLVNVFAGMLATIVSSPMNYVRNMHYATPPGKPPADIVAILLHLNNETRAHTTLARKWNHVQSRLRIGWGTARVGCGMAFASKMYSMCSESRDGVIDKVHLRTVSNNISGGSGSGSGNGGDSSSSCS